MSTFTGDFNERQMDKIRRGELMYAHASSHSAVIPAEQGNAHADGTTQLALRHYPSIASASPPSELDNAQWRPHVDDSVTILRERSDAEEGDVIFTVDSKLTVTEGSVFGKKKLPIQTFCKSAMDRTQELTKAIGEVQAMISEEDKALFKIGSFGGLRHRNNAADNKHPGRAAYAAERRRLQSSHTTLDSIFENIKRTDEVGASVEACANDNSYFEAIDQVTKADHRAVESFLEEKRHELEASASRLCPEDVGLVKSWLEVHGQRAEARRVSSISDTYNDRKVKLYAGREIPAAVQADLKKVEKFLRDSNAESGRMHRKFHQDFHSKYDKSSVKGLPTSVAEWEALWTSRHPQIGRVDLRSSLIHPPGDEAHEKAAISLRAVYSVDDGATWQPLEAEVGVADTGDSFAPTVDTWKLQDRRGTLPGEHMLLDLDRQLSQISRDTSNAPDAALETTATPQDLKSHGTSEISATQRAGETRESYVSRARTEEAERLMRTRGTLEIERCWHEEAERTKQAYEACLESEMKIADPQTEEEKSLLEEWKDTCKTTLTCRQARYLSTMHDHLAGSTQGEEQQRHMEAAQQRGTEWQTQCQEGLRKQQALESALQDRYGDPLIPPSGKIWRQRFQSHGRVPIEVYASAAPSWIREAVAHESGAGNASCAESSLENASCRKSGGVPSVIQKTFDGLATGAEATSPGNWISSDNVKLRFGGTIDSDPDDTATS
ncbi:hypothetical protein IAU59_002781 [Kwoniella sp. CBS 9459]